MALVVQNPSTNAGDVRDAFSKESSPNTWLWNGLMNEDLELRSSKCLRKEKS